MIEVTCLSAAAYTTGWDSRKELVCLVCLVVLVCLVGQDKRDERNKPNKPEKQQQRGQPSKEAPDGRKGRMLELRRHEGIADGNDAVHDGMDSAEIGVATGNQPWKCKATVW